MGLLSQEMEPVVRSTGKSKVTSEILRYFRGVGRGAGGRCAGYSLVENRGTQGDL